MLKVTWKFSEIFKTEPGSNLTPPSSPLDSPPTPAFPPTTSHYISTFRPTSRRTNSLSPDKDRDPLSKLLRFLKTFYRELASRDHVTNIPWTPNLPPGTTCPAHFEPALQLVPFPSGAHRSGGQESGDPRDWIRLDQILSTVRTSDGALHEAPRRVVIEGGPCSGKTTLCLKILHSWATQKDWIGPSTQLALFVPLRELRGCSLAHYLSKELLPKVAGGSNSFLQVWKNLHLLEDRLLFVLDGYDEAVRVNGLESCKTGNLGGGRDALGDAVELLEGRLFPDCRIIITCSTGWSGEMSSFIQRRVLLHGLEMIHVEQLCTVYFGAQKKFDLNKFLDIMRELKPLSCWPLGWLLLCVLYEEEGRIPKDNLELHQDLFKCLIRRSLIDKGLLSISNTSTDLPGHCKKLLAEFGKLALSCIKEDRYLYIDSEIKAHCRSSSIDLTELGFLVRGLNFGKSQNQKRRLDYYSPIHKSFAEFLSAYYISSVVHYANILRRELEDLPGLSSGFNSNIDSSTVSILKFLMGLLGRKGHLVFNQFCPLDLSTRPLYMLLQAAGPSEANVTAVSKLVGASNGHWNSNVSKASAKEQIPLVHTSPLELEGWAWVLKNPACTLEALELVFQFDKGTDCESLLDMFFAALSANDSVKMVRISSLLGHEFSSAEIERLSVYVKTTLPKTKLNTFELVITCLEDSAHDRFQILVDALAESLEHAASSNLNKIVLDLNLGTSQVVQLCRALERAPQITVLHLPHLGCGRDGLRAISALIRQRPLLALNLTGSWGMRREEPQSSCAISAPSSSGISVGSGSGSSNVSSLQQIVKQTSVASSSSPKTSSSSYYFSSLPRGLGGYNSLGRPATLPRQPLTQISPDGYSTTDHKRNSDSVMFQRLFQPLPSCDSAIHSGSGFHDVFEALRDPGCKLKSLNVSKCLLSMEDSLCLGESIRKSHCLDALRLEGGTRLGEVIPVLLGLADNRSLQLLDLGSQRLVLDDGPTQIVLQALIKNSSLKLLSLEGWTFRIEDEASIPMFLTFLESTSVRDLDLSNCRLHVAIHHSNLLHLSRQEDIVQELLTSMPHLTCPSIVFLRLGTFQLSINEKLILRGPHLLPFLTGFTNLTDLDLSLDRTNINSNTIPLVIDDKSLLAFFQLLSTSFRKLQSLKLSNWRMSLDDYEKTLKQVGRYLKICSISYLKLNHIIVKDNSTKGTSLEHYFIQTVISSLNYLTWLSIMGVVLTPGQGSIIGKTIRDKYCGTLLEISVKNIPIESIKSIIHVLDHNGSHGNNKILVTFVGGPSCNLRIQRMLTSSKHYNGNHNVYLSANSGKLKKFTSIS
ncbi:hypothetical protein M8J77_019927 [Diaphorina citri]|nr:hypothetical protein M8J77_019927 [Diaphorina citri]